MCSFEIQIYMDALLLLLSDKIDIRAEILTRLQEDDFYLESVGEELRSACDELGLDTDGIITKFENRPREELMEYISFSEEDIAFDYEESAKCKDRRLCAFRIGCDFDLDGYLEDVRKISLFAYVTRKNISQPIQLEIGLDKVIYDKTGNGNDTRYLTVRIDGKDVTQMVAEAANLKISKAQGTYGRLIIHGSGMDMGFALQDRVYRAAYQAGYPNMFDRDGYKYLGKRMYGRYSQR